MLTSSSIGLFNVLREKEHLAYSVYSDFDKIGDTGEVYCNILTTTDNKETGEQSFENVQKSIDGFKRQIACLKNSEYSDEDLESAKKILDEESKMWYFSASALYEMLEDEKRSKRQHEISDKKLMFRIFSLESYCDYFNIYHEDALALFREYDVFNFLDDTFEVLHTQDEKYIIDSIKKYIISRRKGR